MWQMPVLITDLGHMITKQFSARENSLTESLKHVFGGKPTSRSSPL